MPIPGDVQYRPGDILKERYRIMDVIGRGSMGEVYSAEHLSLRKHVAIKMMHVHISGNTEALRRFRREASLVANLDNPHICQVTDFDSTEHGDFYIVMELLNGETLRARLEREHTLDVSCALRIMRDLLSALDTTHANHIVYRDVKPENIMLERIEDRDDYVKLIDFGIVRTDDPNSISGLPKLKETGKVYGTPQYLSPEQVIGEDVDHRADLYSCGCTMYEMLEGIPPFEARNYVMLLNKHLTFAPPHLSVKIEHLGAIDAVIQKLLQKAPDNRFQTAREVRDALNNIVNPSMPTPSLELRFEQDWVSSTLESEFVPVSTPPESASTPAEPLVSTTQPTVRTDTPTLNGNTNPNLISPNNVVSAEIPATRASNIVGILKIVAVVLLCVAVVIIFLRQKALMEQQNHVRDVHANHVSREDVPKSEMAAQMQTNPGKKNDVFVLSKERLAEYAQIECSIDDDPVLLANEEMRQASEDCKNGEYEKAYVVCEKYKNKYAESIRFNMIRTLVTFATGKFKYGIDALTRITQGDPEAMCNPLIRDINYALIEDDKVFEISMNVAGSLVDPGNSTRAVAWLILAHPCDNYQRVYERDMAMYDKIDIRDRDPAGEWIYQGVYMWRQYSSCEERKEKVYTYLLDMFDRGCDPDHGSRKDTGACIRCYPVFKQLKAELDARVNTQ